MDKAYALIGEVLVATIVYDENNKKFNIRPNCITYAEEQKDSLNEVLEFCKSILPRKCGSMLRIVKLKAESSDNANEKICETNHGRT